MSESVGGGSDPRRPQAEGAPLNLRKVVRRTRNMRDAEMIIRWDSYTGDLTGLATRLLLQVGAISRDGPTQTHTLHVNELTPGSPDLVARTTLVEGESTIRVNWVGEKQKKPRVDLYDYMLLKEFTVEYGMRAHIPVERPKDGDPRLIFYFSKVYYTPTRTGKSRRKSSSGEAESRATDAAGGVTIDQDEIEETEE